MTILHIITGLYTGGAERVVLDLTRAYKEQKHIVYVISLSKKDDLIKSFYDIGVYPIIYDFSRISLFVSNLICIIKFIRRNNIDIVHLHLSHPVILSPFIYCFTKTKMVFTSHSFNVGSKIRELYIWLFKNFRHVDILFSKNQYKYFYKKNFHIISNGVDVDPYALFFPKFDVFTFIAIGRLTTVKNHVVLVDFMQKMIYVHKKNVQLIIVGDGDLRSTVENKIHEFRLDNHVHLYGIRNDINVLMAKSHCLLLPSLWEGLPMVLLESGASRLPIICTNVGSVATLLNEDNSYVCSLKDFEKNMLYVIDNYKEAVHKANILYQVIRDGYSIKNIANKHLELYRSLLKP
jgi:glycosyltransferase involved in cell wall biosynthesis